MQTQGIRNDTEEPGLLQLEKGRGYATKCLQSKEIRLHRLQNGGQKCNKTRVVLKRSKREVGLDVP